jgi:N-carbamoylputrescine amidase
VSRPVRIGIAQIGATPEDAPGSRARTVAAVREATEAGASVVVLPELCVPGYTTDRRILDAAAESLVGPTVTAWQDVASTTNAVVVGGICESTDDGMYNSAVVVGASGVLGVYRKLHLFAAEKAVFVPGDRGLPIVDTPHGPIGVCVCYDLRFPEVARILALRGAEIIAVPTAWLPGFDQVRWDESGMCPQGHGATLQANLDQVFVACASAVGRAGGLEFLGASIVADPYGRLALGPLSGHTEDVVVVGIDLDDVARAQHRGEGIDPRADRRTDVYGLAYGDHLL